MFEKHYIDRFKMKLSPTPTENGCIEFTAALSAGGYGRFHYRYAGKLRVSKKRGRCGQLAHRFAYELHSGEKIPKGMHVLHRCDNRACCNPEHLFLGTLADNNRDRDEKGRHNPVYGEDHGRAKLTNMQAMIVYASPLPSRTLAQMYDMSVTAINNIKAKRSYAIIHQGDSSDGN
jgi:hypothetical protein